MGIAIGEIYWVDLGHSGAKHRQHGNRPCIVIQNNNLNWGDIGTVLVAPCTTKDKKNPQYHAEVNYKFLRDSVVLCENIQVVDKDMLSESRYIGRLRKPDMDKVRKCIANVLLMNKDESEAD